MDSRFTVSVRTFKGTKKVTGSNLQEEISKGLIDPMNTFINKKINELVGIKTVQEAANMRMQLTYGEEINYVNRLCNFVAALFQRIVSRTPMDEEYEFDTTDKNGNQIHIIHTPDGSVLRKDWVLSIGDIVISANDIYAIKSDAFLEFNNREDKRIIYKLLISKLKATTKNKEALEMVFKDGEACFQNSNPHFKIVEYGGYKKDSASRKGKHYEHGVVNGFTYQAPYGMLRISLLEAAKVMRTISKNYSLGMSVYHTRTLNSRLTRYKNKIVSPMVAKKLFSNQEKNADGSSKKVIYYLSEGTYIDPKTGKEKRKRIKKTIDISTLINSSDLINVAKHFKIEDMFTGAFGDALGGEGFLDAGGDL